MVRRWSDSLKNDTKMVIKATTLNTKLHTFTSDANVLGTLLLGYALSLRLCETGHQPHSQEKNSSDESIDWNPVDPKQILIEVKASKTNPWSHESKLIHASCNCNGSIRITPCSVDYLK